MRALLPMMWIWVHGIGAYEDTRRDRQPRRPPLLVVVAQDAKHDDGSVEAEKVWQTRK